MHSDSLFEALVRAKSQPSRAFRDTQAALGAVNDVGDGYLKGAEIGESIRKRKLAQQTLAEALGGQVPEKLKALSQLTAEQTGSFSPILKYGFETEETSKPSRVMTDVDALNLGTVPQGTKIVPTGAFGASAARLHREEEKEATAKKLMNESSIRKADIAMGKVDQALSKVGALTAGAGGTVMGMVPGTSARDLQRDLDTIEALTSFDALQEMRNNSPTGGALGQVAVRELDLLGATIASLKRDQSPESLRSNLSAVKKHYQNWKDAVAKSGSGQNGFGATSVPSFNTPEEAEASGHKGPAIIGGRRAVIH